MQVKLHKMQGPVRRAAGYARRARGWFPLTNLGLAVTLIAAGTYWGFAKPHADHALSLAAQMALLLVALALAGVLVGVLLVSFRLRRLSAQGSALTFEARRGFARGLELSSLPWLPVLELSWRWAAPIGVDVTLVRSGGRLREEVSSPGRAQVSEVVRVFVLEDGFGLARWELRHTEARELRILPALGRLRQAPLLESLAAGDDLPHPRGRSAGDRVDMRRYVRGDPLRLALWKVYARTGQLMVRTPERALAQSVRVVAYLPAAEGDEAAAAVARWAIEGGTLGEQWWFNADGSEGWTSDVSEAVQRIMRSRHVRDESRGGGEGLSGFLKQAHTIQEARIVVFVPGRPGPWLERVARQVQRHARNVSCVVGIDGLKAENDAPKLWARAQAALRRPLPPDPEVEAQVTPDQLQVVCRRLQRAGAEVAVLDREAGRVMSLGRSGGLDGVHRGRARPSEGQAA